MTDRTYDSISQLVSSTSESVTITYPAGRTAANYRPDGDHKITGANWTELSSKLGHITLAFGPASVVVTNNTDRQFKAGETIHLHLDREGAADDLALNVRVTDRFPVFLDLGAPATADADGFFASQNLTAAGVASVSTTVAAAIAAAALGGVADVPRNVVAAWTGTAVLTVTGTDEYGAVLKESSASGTSFTGKKAFKTVTGISVSADVTGLTVGTGTVLGLPIFVGTGQIITQYDNGAVVTNGTIVAGDNTAPSATTGDVRGTISPNSAPNGTKRTAVVAMVASKTYKGLPQYAG